MIFYNWTIVLLEHRGHLVKTMTCHFFFSWKLALTSWQKKYFVTTLPSRNIFPEILFHKVAFQEYSVTKVAFWKYSVTKLPSRKILSQICVPGGVRARRHMREPVEEKWVKYQARSFSSCVLTSAQIYQRSYNLWIKVDWPRIGIAASSNLSDHVSPCTCSPTDLSTILSRISNRPSVRREEVDPKLTFSELVLSKALHWLPDIWQEDELKI